MKYTVSNTINAPLEKVTDKFIEPEGALEWMEGITAVRRISGTPYTTGAISEWDSNYKNREMTMSETVLESNLPDSIKFQYSSKMGLNEVEIKFEKIDEHTTRQIGNNYFEMKGFMKIIGFLFKGMFKKQSLKYMNGFKAYCEK